MRPIKQVDNTLEAGDCLRASVASLFDFELHQVPHFILFGDKWWQVLCDFIYSLGDEVHDCVYPHKHSTKRIRSRLKKEANVNEVILAIGKNTILEKGCESYHAILIDGGGFVIHDPRDKADWLGINIIENGMLAYWIPIRRRICHRT